MKCLIIVLCLCLLPAISTAGDRSDNFLDFGHSEGVRHQNNNQLFPPGSYFNPYVIKDGSTGRTYEIRSKYPSFNQGNQGFNLLEPGTRYNPWVVEEK